jgi:hypothetical protein
MNEKGQEGRERNLVIPIVVEGGNKKAVGRLYDKRKNIIIHQNLCRHKKVQYKKFSQSKKSSQFCLVKSKISSTR